MRCRLVQERFAVRKGLGTLCLLLLQLLKPLFRKDELRGRIGSGEGR